MTDIVYVDNETHSFTQSVPKEEENRISPLAYVDTGSNGNFLEPVRDARVWLFDFFLVEPIQAQSKDENGLSLFQKWRAAVGSNRPATVLISNDLESAIGEPPGPLQRYHVIAQKRGVEWIGDKSVATWRRIVELSDGAAMVGEGLKPLPEDGKKVGTYEIGQLCVDVLQIPLKSDWANSAQRQVDRARPPREVPIGTPWAMARAILAWLIAHVLPYPSFLLTDAQASLRLRIRPSSFGALADAIEHGQLNDEPHRVRLSACRYHGPLSNFLGRRWWRAGIDDLAWQLSEADVGFAAAFGQLTKGLPVERLEGIDEPVLLSDADLVELEDVADARDCVRATDEDFPADVEPAWVLISSAREDKKLRAKVIFEDRSLLET